MAPPFNRFYMGGENDIRGFDIWGISPMAYVPSEADVHVLEQRRTQRLQKVIDERAASLRAGDAAIPVYQLIFPGGDTQCVTNFEYRIPIFGPGDPGRLLRRRHQQDLASRPA